MKTVTLKARADEDGIIRLEIPTQQADQELEIVLLMQTLTDEPVDEMGYPIGYFDDTYGSLTGHKIDPRIG